MNKVLNANACLEARHKSSGENSRFLGDGLTFDEYLRQTTAMLRRAHTSLGTIELEKVIAGNAPFELHPAGDIYRGRGKPWRRGVLLTHGLTDSPYFMRYLANFFRENGFRVIVILLPGHGTQPGDLLDVVWQEWAKTVAYGADRLAEQADEIYLAGFSAGGALSVYQSLQDHRIRGLFLFSPALKITPRAAYANLHKLYSWLLPTGKWLDIKPDLDIYKYESFPKNAAAQVYALIRELDAQLPGRVMGIPIFSAASADDVTVYTSATLGFMARTQHPSSRLVLYTTKPENAGNSKDERSLRELRDMAKLERVNSAAPNQKILSSAHTAIILSGDDAHYGISGEYCNCAHYYPDNMENYAACLTYPELAQQGEITAQNLDARLLRRLMYNPNFAALKVSMRQFIDTL